MSAGDPEPTDPSVAFGILTQEAAKFRAWAATYDDIGTNGERETEYEDWGHAHIAVDDALKAAPLSTWPSAVVDDLLYLLARDNECERTVYLIAQYPEALLWIAEVVSDRGEWEAKWQVADRLGHAGIALERCGVALTRLANDPHEYVRRRTLKTLVRLGAPDAETYALKSWAESGETRTWARMAALAALKQIGSAHYVALLAHAFSDSDELLADYARRLESGNANL